MGLDFCWIKSLTRLKLGFSQNGKCFRMPAITEEVMKLEIVWRNPVPLTMAEHTLQKVSSDEFGAVYSVTNPDLTQQFELIQGAA